jgi:hypothetical protein
MEAGRGRDPPGAVDARQQHEAVAVQVQGGDLAVVEGDLQVGAREPGWPVSAAGGSGRGSGSVAPGTAELRYW